MCQIKPSLVCAIAETDRMLPPECQPVSGKCEIWRNNGTDPNFATFQKERTYLGFRKMPVHCHGFSVGIGKYSALCPTIWAKIKKKLAAPRCCNASISKESVGLLNSVVAD